MLFRPQYYKIVFKACFGYAWKTHTTFSMCSTWKFLEITVLLLMPSTQCTKSWVSLYISPSLSCRKRLLTFLPGTEAFMKPLSHWNIFNCSLPHFYVKMHISLWCLCLILFHRERPGCTILMLHWRYLSTDRCYSVIDLLCSTGIGTRVWSPWWEPWLRCFFILKEGNQDTKHGILSEAGIPVLSNAGIEQNAKLFFALWYHSVPMFVLFFFK